MSLNTRIQDLQNGIDNFYWLMTIYGKRKGNNGWVGTEFGAAENSSLVDFNTFFTNNNFKNITSGITASAFDIPMNSK